MGWAESVLNATDDLFSKKRYNFETENFQYFVVTPKYMQRIDLIARDFLGNKNLGWLIAEFNDIVDPFDEIYLGKSLKIPYVSEVTTLLTRLSDSTEVSVVV